MDHDKVRLRLDRSRQLATRNRRFVKKIVPPPDLPIHEGPRILVSVQDRLDTDTPRVTS